MTTTKSQLSTDSEQLLSEINHLKSIIETLKNVNKELSDRVNELKCFNEEIVSTIEDYWDIFEDKGINYIMERFIKRVHDMFVSNGKLEMDPEMKTITEDITYFAEAFRDLRHLKSLDGLSNWNVSNAIDMSEMFRECEHLEDISGLSNWDVSNVNDFQGMFCGCSLIVSFWKIMKDFLIGMSLKELTSV